MKKNVDKMKDETCGNQIEEFVGARVKLYCFRTCDEEVIY